MLARAGAGECLARQAESLKPYTTFRIGGPARYFIHAASPEEMRRAVEWAASQSLPVFVLGGGSNILVSDEGFDGLVLHPDYKGIEVIRDEAKTVILQVNAGEAWDEVVHYAVERGWWGIENLSHIPGQAGGALVQNIGAYGQQVSDVVESVSVMEIASGASRMLNAGECGFGYRRSIFNTSERGKLAIIRFSLRLTGLNHPKLDYPDLRDYFEQRQVPRPSLRDIRQAIITIRDRKFPFPREERGGNAGSFFKNLTLDERGYEALLENLRRNFTARELERLEQIRHRFPAAAQIKIPTAFLIDICGLKGFRVGAAQVNENQPLVLLNQGGASAREVLALARHIRDTVRARTGMSISIEPELVGFREDPL